MTHVGGQTLSRRPEDVVLCIDTSRSMYRQDYYPNRIEAAKKAALEFARAKNKLDPNDRIGIVTFSDRAQIEQNLSTSIATLDKRLGGIKAGGKSRIDSGLNLSLKVLTGEHRASRGRTLRIIVLSDGRPYGVANDPLRIAVKARSLGVFIDAIGIGSTGSSDFGESLLKALTRLTDGEYAYVTDAHKLLREVIALTPKKLPPRPRRAMRPCTSQPSGGLFLVNLNSSAMCTLCHGVIRASFAYRCSTCGAIFDERCVQQVLQAGRCPFCKSPM